MARRNPPAKWVLPDTLNPVGRKCFCLSVPDDPAYIAAYRGAILALASAYNWADDEGHTAKDVASIMRECIELGECNNMEFIQRDCDLFMVVGGVETLIYTAQTCIDNNIADGTLSRDNSGYLGNPAPGACHVYQVGLKVGNTFVLPNVVSTGDTILLSNWQGGATDWGQLSTTWICPSGTAYNLGSCSNTARANTIYGTDPLQTAPHLAIIAQIGSTYYDVWNSTSGITPATFTVPAGIVNQPIRLLMNIGTGVALTATGEMWGEVTICNTHQWCHVYDFTVSNQSWASWFSLGQPFGTYVASNGWMDSYPTYARDGIVISPPAFSSAYISSIVVHTSAAWSGPSTSMSIEQYEHGATIVNTTANGWTSHEFAVGQTLTRFTIYGDVAVGTQQHWAGYIDRVTLYGTGTNPFGSNNC